MTRVGRDGDDEVDAILRRFHPRNLLIRSRTIPGDGPPITERTLIEFSGSSISRTSGSNLAEMTAEILEAEILQRSFRRDGLAHQRADDLVRLAKRHPALDQIFREVGGERKPARRLAHRIERRIRSAATASPSPRARA